MGRTAKHSVSPERGKFHRALGAVRAFLQAMDATRFDCTLDRIEGVEQKVGQHRHRPRERQAIR